MASITHHHVLHASLHVGMTWNEVIPHILSLQELLAIYDKKTMPHNLFGIAKMHKNNIDTAQYWGHDDHWNKDISEFLKKSNFEGGYKPP